MSDFAFGRTWSRGWNFGYLRGMERALELMKVGKQKQIEKECRHIVRQLNRALKKGKP